MMHVVGHVVRWRYGLDWRERERESTGQDAGMYKGSGIEGENQQ